MPTDPYVSARLDERPRQEPNLPPGVHMPPARPWRANRPGEVAPGWPHGTLLGSPGPNVGYALKLVHRVADTMTLADHEPRDGATVLVADLAMRRAATRGRAPVLEDVEVARVLLGYDGSAEREFAEWRAVAAQEAAHDYPTRRAIVDAVPDDVVALDASRVAARAGEVRAALRAATE